MAIIWLHKQHCHCVLEYTSDQCWYELSKRYEARVFIVWMVTTKCFSELVKVVRIRVITNVAVN
jgi:hypothetical protein